jgi:ribosomal protein S1
MASDSIVELTVGDVVKATVKNILKSYAIVSFGDIVAYLPSSEYSWGRDNNLKIKLKIGAEINVVVIQITDKGVMVSIKRMTKDPWLNVEALYQVNQQTKGKVTKLQRYGAFIELSSGIQGLLHKKEMSHDGMREPSEIVLEGQEIDVIITSIEKADRKISFSIRPFLN